MKNLINYSKIHFIGILGSSMRNLALFAQNFGISVSGSDKSFTNQFISQGILIKKSFAKRELLDVDLAVYSSAIPENNAELRFFKKRGVPCISRAQFLRLLSNEFKTVIAVSGSHGKTTVSAMTAHVFSTLGLSPALHIGGNYKRFFPFSRDFFITEACEYRDSFLTLSPDVGVVLNVEYDHPDYFASLQDVYSSFEKFSKNIRPSGTLIMGKKVLLNAPNTLKVGENAYAQNVREKDGFFSFTPIIDGKVLPDITLSTQGEHNVKNALIVLLIAKACGLDLSCVCFALRSFTGVDRRFQKVIKNNKEYILDYAHHPTEIKATIDTAKLFKKPVTVYFQPHTFSRTKALLDEFCSVLTTADKVVIVQEFPSREGKEMGVSAYELFLKINPYIPSIYQTLSEAKERILQEDTDKNTVLVLGAGDIDTILL